MSVKRVKLGIIVMIIDTSIIIVIIISMKPDKVELVSGNFPLLSSNGILTCQTIAGFLTTIFHPYFDQISSSDRSSNNKDNNSKVLIERFGQCLAVLKLEAARLAALELDKRQFWLALSGIVIIPTIIIIII